jgi:Rad3-related DNA helicase
MGLETDNDKVVDEMSIMRHMRYNDIYDDALVKTFIINLYKEFCGKDITEEHEKWLIARFNENRKLVVLNGKEIPAEIISAFTYTMSFIDIHQQQLNKALLLNNHDALSAMQITTSAGSNVKDASNFINKMMNPGA